jgi:lipopolysaccharide transport system permease protein
VHIRSGRSLFDLDLRALVHHRELLYFLTWRDVKVRYKQAVIGVLWVVLQPLLAITIFTFVFNRLANVPSDGLPYPLFAYAALLPWNFFSQAVTKSANSLVANSHLVSRIYFPRIIIPLSGVLTPIVDFAVSLGFFLVLMLWFGMLPTWRLIALPLFLVAAVVTAFAICLFLSALNVRYRDVGHVVPFLVQFWMYASPVVYPTSLVPERWRPLYSLNPMAAVIDGFRWSLLGAPPPGLAESTISALIVTGLLLWGLIYFRQVERTFADVI